RDRTDAICERRPARRGVRAAQRPTDYREAVDLQTIEQLRQVRGEPQQRRVRTAIRQSDPWTVGRDHPHPKLASDGMARRDVKPAAQPAMAADDRKPGWIPVLAPADRTPVPQPDHLLSASGQHPRNRTARAAWRRARAPEELDESDRLIYKSAECNLQIWLIRAISPGAAPCC